MEEQIARLTAKENERGFYELSYFIPNKVQWSKMTSKIKMIPDRVFIPPSNGKKWGHWEVPVNPRSEQLLTHLRFNLIAFKKKEVKRKLKVPKIPKDHLDIKLRDVSDKLREYQIEGVKYLQHHNYTALNADEMGVGKTAQVISAIRTSRIRPVLFIVPATLKINTQRECEMWLNPKDKDSIYIVTGTKDFNYHNKDIVIINYDILHKHVEFIITQFKPQMVIVDEAHFLKTDAKLVCRYYPDRKVKSNEEIHVNEKGKFIYTKPPKRVIASRMIINGLTEDEIQKSGILWEGVKHKIFMTATPILNTPADIWNLLNMIHPARFTNRKQFEDFFCVSEPGFKPGTIKITGGKHLDLLHCDLVEKYMIRRKTEDVIKELPEGIQTVIPFEMSKKDKKIYDDAENDIMEYIKSVDIKKANRVTEENVALAKFSTLMGLAYEAKKKDSFKFIDSLLEEKDTKVIVFAIHKKAVNELFMHYDTIAVKLNGENTMNEKQEAVDSFQNNKKIRLFIGNIQAAGVGITLTKATRVVFVELGFSISLVHQAIARAVRMGQLKTVLIYFLVADETVESKVAKKLDNKRNMIDAIMEGEETKEESLLSFLWNQYKEN